MHDIEWLELPVTNQRDAQQDRVVSAVIELLGLIFVGNLRVLRIMYCESSRSSPKGLARQCWRITAVEEVERTTRSQR